MFASSPCSHPAQLFHIIHDGTTCCLEGSITQHFFLKTLASTCDSWVALSQIYVFTHTKRHLPEKQAHFQTGTYMESSIWGTHPDSFGIFTKLNTSMCAADCSQGDTFKTCFIVLHCFWQRGEEIIQEKKTVELPQVRWRDYSCSLSLCMAEWLLCPRLSSTNPQPMEKDLAAQHPPPPTPLQLHPSKHASVSCVKPPSFNFHRSGMMCRTVTTALERGRESPSKREGGSDRAGDAGERWKWRREKLYASVWKLKAQHLQIRGSASL